MGLAGMMIPVLVDVLGPIIKDALGSQPGSKDPDDATKEAADAVAGAVKSEIDLLVADAASADRFRSWWRPAFGWVGVFSVGYEFLIRPLATPFIPLISATPLPAIPADALWPLVGGLLGIAGLRTYEKKTGVAENAGAVIGKVIKSAVERAAK